MGRVDSKLFHPRAPSDTEPRPLDLPPSRFPFRHLSTPPVISSCRYLNTLHIRTMPDTFLSRRRGRRLRSTQRCIVVIPPLRIRYIDIRLLARGDRTGGRRRGGGYGKSATEMVSCARADRWGVKPPIKRPLVSARRTGDISISSIALKLLVTSRVFREQRGTD